MKTSVYFNQCKKKANPSDQRKHNFDIPNCQNLMQSIHAGVLTLRQSSIQCVSCFLPRSSHLSGIICNHLVWAPYSSFKNFKLLPNLTQVTFSETGFLYCDFQTKAVTDLHIPACIPICRSYRRRINTEERQRSSLLLGGQRLNSLPCQLFCTRTIGRKD